jgi:hypothetical protein
MLNGLIKNVVFLFLLAQGGTTGVLRTGDVARRLTPQDIEALIPALPPGAKPWLLNADPPQISTSIEAVQVYLEPSSATETLRRGSVVTVSRQTPPAGQAWNARLSEEYAQVAILGRSFGQINDDQDPNRPFRVIGKFEESELIRLVNLVRSIATPPAGSADDQLLARTVLLLPIFSVLRRDSQTVEVNLRIASLKGQMVMLEKRGEDWVVVSVRKLDRLIALIQ